MRYSNAGSRTGPVACETPTNLNARDAWAGAGHLAPLTGPGFGRHAPLKIGKKKPPDNPGGFWFSDAEMVQHAAAPTGRLDRKANEILVPPRKTQVHPAVPAA